MSKELELILQVTTGEENIALLENKKLVQLHQQDKKFQFSVGDIYLAKIRKIMPGLNAAFVNVGYEKDAFLHYLDLGPQFRSLQKYIDLRIKHGKKLDFEKFNRLPDIDKEGKIDQVLKEGRYVLVQITKEPISKKGPRLSSEVSIAGRNLVLLPFSDKVSVSQKIESIEERDRLKQLLRSITPNNYGIIVRTAAENMKVADLDKELRQLLEKWENTLNNLRNIKPPKLVLRELGRSSAIVRDSLNADFNHIYIDDEVVYQDIKDYISEIAPSKKKIIKHYTGRTPIFEHFGINKQIKTLFGRTVPFNQGSYLIIEHTEAFHVIDVNSGNRSEPKENQESNALETNLLAAVEIARQLRLRDMGGIIVIDFIDMQQASNRQLLFDKMKEFMADDKTKHTILPLSRFGLMQLTRQRVRPEMNIKTYEKCPTCKGSGEVIPAIVYVDELGNKINAIRESHPRVKKLYITLHPFLAAYITRGWFKSIKKEWQKTYKCKIHILENTSFTILQHEIVDSELNSLE